MHSESRLHAIYSPLNNMQRKVKTGMTRVNVKEYGYKTYEQRCVECAEWLPVDTEFWAIKHKRGSDKVYLSRACRCCKAV